MLVQVRAMRQTFQVRQSTRNILVVGFLLDLRSLDGAQFRIASRPFLTSAHFSPLLTNQTKSGSYSSRHP